MVMAVFVNKHQKINLKNCHKNIFNNKIQFINLSLNMYRRSCMIFIQSINQYLRPMSNPRVFWSDLL